MNSALTNLVDWAAARLPGRPYLLRSQAPAVGPLVENASVQEALLEHERLARELKIAEQVQHQLLPRTRTGGPGL